MVYTTFLKSGLDVLLHNSNIEIVTEPSLVVLYRVYLIYFPFNHTDFLDNLTGVLIELQFIDYVDW